MWARQLKGANASYQILTIGDSTHINDNRFLITKSTINNVISLPINNSYSIGISTSFGMNLEQQSDVLFVLIYRKKAFHTKVWP